MSFNSKILKNNSSFFNFLIKSLNKKWISSFLKSAMFTIILTCSSLAYAENLILFDSISIIYHPVSTNNKAAQKYFDQGLAFLYAFNHEFAFKSFEEAAKNDPNLAMAYWGMAYAIGPNINSEMSQEKALQAYDYIQKALALSSNATKNEQDYILALSKRYEKNPSLNRKDLDAAYKIAMQEVKDRWYEDLDAKALYAESIMDLSPWDLWTKEGDFKPGVSEAIDVLSQCLKKDPYHLGANHYYVHLFEGSNQPERALTEAQRLRVLFIDSGHLLHMGAHILIPCGFYHEAALSNIEAIKVDKEYIKMFGKEGYGLHYMSHNLSSLVRALTLEGCYGQAISYSLELKEFVSSHVLEMTSLEKYALKPLNTYLNFYKWDEVFNYRRPDESLKTSNLFYSYAKAYALASKGNIEQSLSIYKEFKKEKKTLSDAETIGYNKSINIFEIADLNLQARIYEAQGQIEKAHAALREAYIRENNLKYNEPPDWETIQGLSFAAFLIRQAEFNEAKNIIDKELQKHPRNPRALFLLMHALRGLNETINFGWVEHEFETAWQYSDIILNLKDM